MREVFRSRAKATCIFIMKRIAIYVDIWKNFQKPKVPARRRQSQFSSKCKPDDRFSHRVCAKKKKQIVMQFQWRGIVRENRSLGLLYRATCRKVRGELVYEIFLLLIHNVILQ